MRFLLDIPRNFYDSFSINPVITEKNRPINKWTFSLLISLSLLLLALRLNGLNPISSYLWAEDGHIFLPQAKSFGIASLLQPYADYLHLYPRLVALIANQFSLIYQPKILFWGWVLAYAFSFSIIIQRAMAVGIGTFSLFGLVFLMLIQPNQGEVFFTVTNAQWCLGAALCIWVLSSESEQMSFLSFIGKLPILILLGLTGPFSLIILPAMFIKAFIFKDIKKNILLYVSVFFCGIIQLLIILHSNTTSTLEHLDSLRLWVFAFIHINLFNVNSTFKLTAAILFWLIFFFSIVRNNKENFKSKDLILTLLYFFTAELIIFLAGHKCKEYVLLSAGGNRYTWIAYLLILFGVALATKRQYFIQCILGILLFFAFYQNYTVLLREDLKFESYANFSNYKLIDLPINPPVGKVFPPLHVTAGPVIDKSYLLEQQKLNLANFTSKSISIKPGHETGIRLSWSTDNSLLSYTKKINCDKAKDIGVEMNIQPFSPGFIGFLWSSSENLAPEKSFNFWYPAEKVTIHYAFPNHPTGNYIGLNFTSASGSAEINKIIVYCLP